MQVFSWRNALIEISESFSFDFYITWSCRKIAKTLTDVWLELFVPFSCSTANFFKSLEILEKIFVLRVITGILNENTTRAIVALQYLCTSILLFLFIHRNLKQCSKLSRIFYLFQFQFESNLVLKFYKSFQIKYTD